MRSDTAECKCRAVSCWPFIIFAATQYCGRFRGKANMTTYELVPYRRALLRDLAASIGAGAMSPGCTSHTAWMTENARPIIGSRRRDAKQAKLRSQGSRI